MVGNVRRGSDGEGRTGTYITNIYLTLCSTKNCVHIHVCFDTGANGQHCDDGKTDRHQQVLPKLGRCQQSRRRYRGPNRQNVKTSNRFAHEMFVCEIFASVHESSSLTTATVTVADLMAALQNVMGVLQETES